MNSSSPWFHYGDIRGFKTGIFDSEKGSHPRTDIVMDEKGDLVTDSHTILAMWRNHFSQLLNVHGVNELRQTEIQTYSRACSG
jgi:hypothetical protein